MKRECIWNGRTIAYDLQRKNVKNLNLRVRADGRISVSAHPRVHDSVIDAFVESRAEWILGALAKCEQAQKNHPIPLTYTDGETVRVLGQSLILRVLAGTCHTVEHKDGTLLLTVKDPIDTVQTKQVFDSWCEQLCRRTVESICAQIYPTFAQLGVLPPVLRFRKMKSRWGSCHPQKGILTFNTKLSEVPIPCIEYVVFHEFTHFLHPDHSPRFYAALSSFLPDWKERKRVLEQGNTE